MQCIVRCVSSSSNYVLVAVVTKTNSMRLSRVLHVFRALFFVSPVVSDNQRVSLELSTWSNY